MDVLFANSGEVKESNPRLLNLDMDNEGSMKMSFCSSVGSTDLDSNDKSTTKLVSTHKFEAKITKSDFFDISIISKKNGIILYQRSIKKNTLSDASSKENHISFHLYAIKNINGIYCGWFKIKCSYSHFYCGS